MNLNVSKIASYCNGRILCGQDDTGVTSVSWDSRTIKPGGLYVALPGQRFDGHDFCLDAIRSGAECVLISREPDPQTLSAIDAAHAAAILVDDSAQAFSHLAKNWRNHLSGSVIALTGSSGKTTTKNLVRDVLAAAGTVVATIANQNNELGVPSTVLAADETTDFCVVEMGMRGLGQLAELCEIVRPTAALVTNVGTSHMELLGSREAIAQAKAEPLAALCDDGVTFLNSSEAYLLELLNFGNLDVREIETVFFDGSGAEPASFEAHAPKVYATDISFDNLARPTFTLHVPGSSAVCTLLLSGQHNVVNAMAAAAVGSHFGMNAGDIAAALGASQPVSGRAAVIAAQCGARVVDDSYNANPDSMCASLSTFRAMAVSGRRIAVLGDMGELGDYSVEGHRRVGRAAAESMLDMLICVGPRSIDIAQAAEEAGMASAAIECVDNANDALLLVKDFLQADDAILVKASHSTGLDALVKGLVD